MRSCSQGRRRRGTCGPGIQPRKILPPGRRRCRRKRKAPSGAPISRGVPESRAVRDLRSPRTRPGNRSRRGNSFDPICILFCNHHVSLFMRVCIAFSFHLLRSICTWLSLRDLPWLFNTHIDKWSRNAAHMFRTHWNEGGNRHSHLDCTPRDTQYRPRS